MTSLVDFARPPWLSDADDHEETEGGSVDVNNESEEKNEDARLSPLDCLVDPLVLRTRVQQTVLQTAPGIERIDSGFYNAMQIGLREHMIRVLTEMSANAKHRTEKIPQNAVVTSDPDSILRARIRAEIESEREIEEEKARVEKERLEKEQMADMEREMEEELEEMMREQEMTARGQEYVPKKKKKARKKTSALPEAVMMAERLDQFHRTNAAAFLAMQNVGPKFKKAPDPISSEVLVAALARIDSSLEKIEQTLKKVAWTSQTAARLRNLQRLLQKQTVSFGNNDNQLACAREGRASAGTGLNEHQQSEAQDLLHRLEAYRVLVRKRDELRKMRRAAEMRNPERREQLLLTEQTKNPKSACVDVGGRDTNSGDGPGVVSSVPKRVLTFQDAQACSSQLIPLRVFEKHALRKLCQEVQKRHGDTIPAAFTQKNKKRRHA